MALSPSTMFLFLETNSLLKYELMLPKTVKKINKPTCIIEDNIISEYWKVRKDPKKFFEYTHIDTKVFDYILECVRDKLTGKYENKICKLRNAEDRLFVTIQFMASGISLTELSKKIDISRSTITRIISSTLTAIWESLHDVHLKPPTPDEMPAAADKFFTKWRFPNAVGAIGAKFIPTKIILNKRHRYTTEKTLRKISLVLTAVADADFRFSAIDMSRDISDQDERSFDDIFGIAGFRELPGSTGKMPYVILGNETFPLKTHLLRPYNKRFVVLNKNCAIYNKRLKAARITVEAAFEILTDKFTVFGNPLILDLEMVSLVVRAGCLLHNIVKDIDGDTDSHFRDIGKEDKGYLNLFLVKRKFGRQNNRSSVLAGQIRDLFRDYILQHNNM